MMTEKNNGAVEVAAIMIDMETLERVAPIIRTAAHPLRLRILDFLDQAGDSRTVSEIIAAADAEQAVVSQQLRIMKDVGVLSAKRRGNFVYYGIADSSILFLLNCIRQHQSGGRPYRP
jgi:ArsR family transcriptional regulator